MFAPFVKDSGWPSPLATFCQAERESPADAAKVWKDCRTNWHRLSHIEGADMQDVWNQFQPATRGRPFSNLQSRGKCAGQAYWKLNTTERSALLLCRWVLDTTLTLRRVAACGQQTFLTLSLSLYSLLPSTEFEQTLIESLHVLQRQSRYI